MPAGVAAEMFVDGERIATVTVDSPGIPIAAGVRHIKLVGTNGLSCDDPKVRLEAGKTTTLECSFGMTGSNGAGSAAVNAGSGAAQVAQGSAAPATGSGDAKTVEHAADANATDAKATDAKTETKASDTKVDPKTDAKKSDGKTTESKTDVMASDSKRTVETKRLGDTRKLGDGDKKDTETKSGDKASAGDPSKGYLQVFSKPPAKILVDGNDSGLKTPISGHTLGLTPGKHKITFVIGDDRFTYPVMIKAGVTDTMSKDLQ
jgi:hypothetical protein